MKTTEKKVPALRFPEFEGEWEEKKLSQVCTIKTGGKDTKDRIDDGKYPFYVRSDKVEAIDSYVLDTEAILTSGDGVGVGRNFHYINGKFNYHQRVYALYNFHLKYNGKFIYYFFSENFFQRVMRLSAKNSVDSVRMDMISKMPISFPSLPEQQKIADFLSATDKRLELLKEKMQGLEDYKRGAMQRIFSQELRFTRADGSAYPDWEEKKLGEIAEFIRNGISKTQNLSQSGYKVTRIETISTGKVDMSKVGYIDNVDNIENYRLHTGDILFSNINSVAHIGKTAIIGEDIDNLFHGMNLLCIRLKKNIVNPMYMYNYLNYDVIRGYFQSVCNQAVNQASINQSELSKTKIPFPSLPEQTQIANFLSAIDSKTERLSEQIEAMEGYKKGLLQQMFV